MSSRIYVLDGAMVTCDQGFTPAKLLVTENQKVKIQGKYKATHMDLQVPQTFGQCKLKPTSGGYLPCMPALQPWTNTAEKATMTGKKFLYQDSECRCAIGGKITIMQHMQTNSAGSITEQFKQIAMTMPGAMLGNDMAPKVVQCYWMDEAGQKKINTIHYGQKAAIFVLTENIDPGKTISINISEQDDKEIDGTQKNWYTPGWYKPMAQPHYNCWKHKKTGTKTSHNPRL